MTKGLDIVLKDVSYERRALAYDAPVKQGLLAWFFLGGSLDFSKINLADGMPDAAIVGAPAVSPFYLSLKSKTNYLRSQQYLPERWSLVTICRSSDAQVGADRPILIGTSDGSATGGSLYANSTTSISLTSNQIDGTETTTLTAAAPWSNWKCLIASADENRADIFNMSTSQTNGEEQIPAGNALVPSISTFAIGSGGGPSSSYAGTSDIAMAAVYDRVLSEGERDAIYARMVDYYGRRSITI